MASYERYFGRCMSREEAKKVRRTERLYDENNGLVPVFNSPNSVIKRLECMPRKKLRDYFRRIGVRCAQEIIVMKVDPSSIEGRVIGPIPQKNGLKEYKIPSGTEVTVIGSLRL